GDKGSGASMSTITGGNIGQVSRFDGLGGAATGGITELAAAASPAGISPLASAGGNLSAVGAPTQLASAPPDLMLSNSGTLGGGSPISSGATFESATLPGYTPVAATSESGNLVAGGASQNIIGDAVQAAGGNLGSTTSDLGLGADFGGGGAAPAGGGGPSAATAAP